MQANNSLCRPAGGWCRLLLVLAVVLAVQVPARSWADLAASRAAVRAGNSKYFQQNYAGAEADFAAAISSDPTWAVPYNNRGLARFHRGNFSGADADFDAAKSRETNYVSAYLNKGKSLAAQKRFAEAAAELEAALLLAPLRPTLHYSLGWVYDEQGRHADARQKYDDALDLNPAYHRARLARGISFARENMVAEAEDDFYAVIRGVTQDPLQSVAAYNLQLLRGQGVAFWDAATAGDFAEGVFALATDQPATAVARLDAARGKEPSVPDIPWIASWAHLKGRDSTSANAALSQAHSLMEHVTLHNTPATPYTLSADVFIDGLRQGSTPANLRLFPSSHDLTLRKQVGMDSWEWTGRINVDTSPGSPQAMRLRMTTVPWFTPFGPVADTDRDGLKDSWERQYFGNLAAAPMEDQPDRDGLINLHEHWMSTDPRDADTDNDGTSDLDEFGAALLQIASLEISNSACRIRFAALRGFQYVVDYADRLGSNAWIELPSSRITGNDSIAEVTDVNPGTTSSRFYRVRLDLSPTPPEGFVWIPPGTFLMGRPTSEASVTPYNETQHPVTITRGFWMGKYEVTQQEFLGLMGYNPSYCNGYQPSSGTNYGTVLTRPVDSVTWYEAAHYCALLTRRERAAWRLPVGYVYRLPTEAEWEYTCRAGTTTSHHYGNELRSGMANFDGRYEYAASGGLIWNENGNYLAATVPVGSYQPNPWDLYDMHGNILEWCYDRYGGDYPSQAVTDPIGPAEGGERICRGGYFRSSGHNCRSACRNRADANSGGGLRVVLAAEGSVPLAPHINGQPQSQVVLPGGFALIGVSVDYDFDLPMTFQWFLNGTNLVGRTNNYFEIYGVQPRDVGKYVAIICNDYGSVTTEPATLRLTTRPTIMRQPESEDVVRGETVRFSVEVTGALGYQWQHDEIGITGATNATLTLPGVGPTASGVYSVVVNYGINSITSNPARLTVVDIPQITLHPQSQAVGLGNTASFSVTVNSAGTVRYQWRFSGTVIPGATNASLSLTNVQFSQAGEYSVAVVNVAGEVVSDPAILTVLMPPLIVQHPQSQSVRIGESVTFIVAVTNTAELPIGYRWRKGGSTLTNQVLYAHTHTLTLTNVQLTNAASYTVVVTNAASYRPGILSNPAQLTVQSE